MERKLSKEELAQKAIELIDEAEQLEERKEWYKAIELYQKAAEKLQQSGYLSHRIQDIYSRVTEINNYLKQQKTYDQAQSQIQKAKLDQLQDQAFTLIDGAKKDEKNRLFNDAIQKYMSAIKLLVECGWTETQLENLKTTIETLAQNIGEEKEMNIEVREPIQYQEALQDTSVSLQIDKKAEAIKTFEDKKKREEENQKKAFYLLDKAKEFEKKKEIGNAILHYEKAVELLNSLGWTQQTQNIYLIIEKLKSDKENIEKSQIKQPQESIYLKEKLLEKPAISQKDIDNKKQKLMEFEQRKKNEEKIQSDAFKLIDLGKRLDNERKYDEAIKDYNESIELFRSIGWDSYIEPIVNTIRDIKDRRQREKEAILNRQRREKELNKFEKMIQEAQKEEVIKVSQDLELKSQEFERIRLEEKKSENQFYSILDNADKFLRGNNYDNALNEYKRALDFLKKMGPGWESYIPTVEATISTIEQQKNVFIEKEVETLRKTEEAKLKALNFQQNVSEQLSLERERLKQRKFQLKGREDELKYREQRKQVAFKLLEAGQNYMSQGDLDKAIYAYQNAGNVFAEIQWNDEVILIEKTIIEIESKKNEILLSEQKRMEELIEHRKKDKLFQIKITEQLELEKEKIRQRELSLIEQKEKFKLYETSRQKAFKLLDDAENYLRFGQYDNAIEIYRNAELKLIELRFPTNVIKENIQKIEEKRREKELQKQEDKEILIQKERENIAFQRKVSEDIDKEKEHLMLKQIQLKKEEQIKETLEKRRNEAFEILDEAERFTKNQDYDKVLESYRIAEIILSELRFPTDSIKNMMQKVSELKNQKQIEKQYQLQKELEKIEEEHQLQAMVEDRQKQYQAEILAKQLASQEKENLIKAQMNAREAANSLLEEAGNYLKRTEPDYDKGISLYVQARSILEENVGWEPEINNMNNLINDLQEEKVRFLERKRIEEQENWKSQQEYINFEQEVKRLNLEHEKQKEQKRFELEKFETQRATADKLKNQALKLINEGKRMAKLGDFDKAYNNFNIAIIKFREIGWNDEIQYIESEINDTKNLENLNKNDELELLKIHEELEQKAKVEQQKREQEGQKLRQSLGEISDLAFDVSKMIEDRKKELVTIKEKEVETIKMEAKDFSRNMGRMLRLKQDILAELKKKEEILKQGIVEEQKIKERKDVDEISRMLKDVAKKRKKE